MLNELTIRCTYGTDTFVPLVGKYTDKKSRKQIILLASFGVLIDQEPTTSQQVFKVTFSKNNPIFSFKWDSKDEAKANFAKYLKLHPHINHADNTNKDGQTYFVLEDKSRNDEIQFDKENAKMEVFFFVRKLDVKGLMEVAYSAMTDPAGKSAKNLFMELCAHDTGLLMQNPTKFLLERKETDYDKKVVIRKATLLGLIKTQESDGKTIFMINNTPIGSVNNLLVYFNENKEQYDYLVKEVSEKDTLPYGLTENISVEEALGLKEKQPRKDTTHSAAQKDENKIKRETEAHAAETRKSLQVAKLKELNVKGWQASGAWSEDARLEKIAKAEKELTPA